MSAFSEMSNGEKALLLGGGALALYFLMKQQSSAAASASTGAAASTSAPLITSSSALSNGYSPSTSATASASQSGTATTAAAASSTASSASDTGKYVGGGYELPNGSGYAPKIVSETYGYYETSTPWTASATVGGTVTLSWYGFKGCTYEVWFGTSPEPSKMQPRTGIGPLNASAQQLTTVDGLTSGTKYYFLLVETEADGSVYHFDVISAVPQLLKDSG